MKYVMMLLMNLCFLITQAQTPSRISFHIKDSAGKLVAYAAALMMKENKIVLTSIADESGFIVFDSVAKGIYNLQITAVNFADKIIELNTELSSIQDVVMPAKNSDLKEVVVTTKKPFIQRLRDRYIVNVDNSVVNAGSTAFEVLQRSPGVTIDPNDVIALKGKQGVLMMIDGKPVAMSGADMINYLKGLSAENVDRLEIITNPSSKYDAAGSSGIIDIRLKKDQRTGTNGTVNAGYGQGVYPKANAGASFNHRNKKMNVFGNYNYSYRKALNHLFLDRRFYENGTFKGADKKDNFTTIPFKTHTARLGADFFVSKNSIIGFVVNTNLSHITRKNANNSVVYDELFQPDFTFKTNAENNDHADNAVANLNFRHNFKQTGRTLTMDADYGRYTNTSITRVGTSYYDLSGSSQQPDYILAGDQKGKLEFKTAKADYTQPLSKTSSLESGFKTRVVSTNNDAKFNDISSGIPENDVNKTNHFLYKEYNNAAYLNYKKDFKKLDVQLGLRAEHTSVKTYQEIGKVNWDSSYLQFFPTAYINYKIKEDHSLGFSVSRRIDRPGYNDLNPFLFLIDVSTYSTGNPALLPQFTWNYELNYTMKQLNFSFTYSHTKNIQNIVIARFRSVFPNIPLSDDNVTVQIPVNLTSADNYSLSVSAPVKINKWWNMINNAEFIYNHFNGNLDGSQLNNGKPEADIKINNSFTLKNNWSAELNGMLNTGGQYGYMVTDPQWALNVGVQKIVLKKKGTIRFNVSDIFWTNLPKAIITYNNYVERWHAQRESRVASLNFTYRFGKNSVQAAKKRATASEEERRRAG